MAQLLPDCRLNYFWIGGSPNTGLPAQRMAEYSAKCIDNGPMEGFWGILKRERYYGKRFTSKKELLDMIENYIRYYNNRRVQRNLGVLTPMEKYNLYLAA